MPLSSVFLSLDDPLSAVLSISVHEIGCVWAGSGGALAWRVPPQAKARMAGISGRR